MLYLCATPIGNLEDVTLRVLRILRECDEVLAEDTRRARKLLSHYDIHKKVSAFNQVNERRLLAGIMAKLGGGDNLALVSDAGMPGLSDPGYVLVKACLDSDIPYTVLPGASATLMALVGSGLPTDDFRFVGFLPRTTGKRAARLEELMRERHTTIFFESPRRLVAALQAVATIDPDRQVVVARELTKMFEEYIRGSVQDILSRLREKDVKGELVVLMAGGAAKETFSEAELRSMVDELVPPLSRKQAVKEVAKRTGLASRHVYEVSLGRGNDT